MEKVSKVVEVYLPVQVTVVDGVAVSAYVDYDGAPWMYVTEEPNLWEESDAPDGEEFVWVDAFDDITERPEHAAAVEFVTRRAP